MTEKGFHSNDSDTAPPITIRLGQAEYNMLVDVASQLHLPVSAVARSVMADAIERATAPILQFGSGGGVE